MGKIIKNDKVYSGTFDDATSVNYDNSVSGLNANSVQEGIDELADGLKNTSVVDNLLSTSTTLPLSANQGRVLDEKISTLDESLGALIITQKITVPFTTQQSTVTSIGRLEACEIDITKNGYTVLGCTLINTLETSAYIYALANYEGYNNKIVARVSLYGLKQFSAKPKAEILVMYMKNK